MSDIFIKNAGQGSAGWRKASNLWVKTSGLGSTGWRSGVGVWIRNLTQWVKVWPLSGIIATRVPYIGYFSSDTYAGRMPNASYPVIRIGDSYFGSNAQWDLNGWNASSYTYRWKLYSEFGSDLGITLRSGTTWSVQAPTSGGNGQDELPTSIWTSTNSTNSDNQFLGFEVTANNSSNSQYNGLSVSTKIKVIRELPINLTASLSTNTPAVGSPITYSSTWQSGEAYKADPNRIYINWYNNTSSSTSGGSPATGTGANTATYTPNANDSGKYLYAVEERQNSGTDYELGIATGIVVSRVTTSPVGAAAPNAFTYSLTNVSSVTTPSTPTQTRVSSTSNDILFEFASLIPEDTLDYTLNLSGPVTNAGNQTITILNLFSNNSDYQTTLTSSANNSNVSSYVVANGKSRTLQFNVSTTTGAKSWKINYTISSASGGNGTYDLNTNSMPRQTIIAGVSNPTVTINSVTAYSELNQTGSTKIGTAGSPTSLSSILKPTASSTTSTSNYTFYTNFQATGSQRRVNLPSAFTSGSTLYVSTNGYINWGGADPTTSIPIPTSGITIAPLNGDLRQGAVSASGTISTGGLWTFSDSTNYWVTWWGNYYQDAAQVARYQVKFYWGQSYADIYIVNNSLTSITPSTTAVQNGASLYQNWSATTSQTSTLLSTATMNRISTQDGVDDNRTAIVAAAPQPPTGGTATVTPETGTAGSTTYAASTSGWTGAPTISYTYAWQGFNRFGFYWETFSTGPNATTFAPTVAQNSNSLAWQLVVTASNGISPNGIAVKAFTVNAPVTPIIPTISMSSNTGITQTAGTINWTSTNQSSFSSTGTFSGTGTTGTSISKTGLTAGTTYTGTVTVTSSTGNTASANYSLTTNSSVSIPSGGSVSLTGGNTAGSTITASTSGWSGSPTSYDVYITTALSPSIPTSSSSRVASSGGGSSTTYTITSFDTVSPVNIFRAFATASNSAGTSGVVQSSNTITAQSSTPATAPGTPGTPTNGWTSGTSYPFTWTAPGAGTVAGGGAATITNYSMIIYEANNSAGTGAVAKTPFNTGSGSSTYTYTSPNSALYYAASVAAINSAGLQGPYSGISQYK